MTLWLLRHAAPDGVAGRCYGRSEVTVPAAATEAVAVQIAAVLPLNTAVWHSPRHRCASLAAALHRLRADLAAPQCDPRLAEMDFGDWEGHAWEAIGAAAVGAWTDNFADARAGTTGESQRMFMARVVDAWDDWTARSEQVLWITHNGVVRAVQLLSGGVRGPVAASAWPAEGLAFGVWRTVARPPTQDEIADRR